MTFTKGKLSSAEQICNQNYPVKTELSLNNISFATDHNRISCQDPWEQSTPVSMILILGLKDLYYQDFFVC